MLLKEGSSTKKSLITEEKKRYLVFTVSYKIILSKIVTNVLYIK